MSHDRSDPKGPSVADTSTERSCPLCRESVLRLFGSKAGYVLGRCASCGVILTKRWPEEAALAELYDHYYDHTNFDLHPVVVDSLDRLACSFEPVRSTGRWLDVGFGAGGLLTIAERRQWACFGTEVSPSSLRFGEERGWVVATDAPDDPRFPVGGFDVVTMIELIEHVTEPVELLKAAARWLRPGGILYITTPNANSINRHALGVGWSVFSPPEHLTIWSARGLSRALRTSGFEPQRVRTEGFNPSEVIARARPSRPGSPCPSRNDAGFALNESFSRNAWRRMLKAGINHGLSAFKVGDSLKIRAIRLAGGHSS